MGFLKVFFVPSKIIMLLIIIALVLLVLKRRQQIAKRLLIASGILYLIFSSGIVATLLLHPLEYHYPYLQHPQDYPQSKAIVLLTAYSVDDQDVPLSSRMNSSSLFRVVETHNIYKHCQNCRVYITGNPDNAAVMQAQLIQLGIPDSAISIDTAATHTYISAVNMRQVFKDEPFFLVTSGGHMPRAMGVFEKQGMRPIAAPTDFIMPKNILMAPIIPKAHHLHFSDLAVTEYAALAWYWVMDRI